MVRAIGLGGLPGFIHPRSGWEAENIATMLGFQAVWGWRCLQRLVRFLLFS